MIRPAQTLSESLQWKRDIFTRNQEALMVQAMLLTATLKRGGKLIAFGNGGSAADAKRVAECLLRQGIAATALPAMFTPDSPGFAALYKAVRRPGDCALAISTSGNSPNVLLTVETAQKENDSVIAFTGNSGGRLRKLVPGALTVGDDKTKVSVARIQEVHLMMVHEFCALTFALLHG